MDEDLHLVDRYLRGDADAVEEIVIKYERQMYAVAYRMTGDREDAKDLTQKAFVRAIEGMRGFRRESSLKTWLYQIAINVTLNHLRGNRREERELEESDAAVHPGALSDIIEKEKRECVKKGLERLSERQRLAIVLRAYEGLSCEETARVMGCSEGAVKAHYHNAVKRLREVMKEKGHEVRS
ncbi:MAG: RNA polymerase sigma factor [Nitrospirae bacterium]|nr:RNA polymerase sigma factor [Nitrospirota bacterium]